MLATDATLTIYDGGAFPYSTESAHDVPDIDQNIIITQPDSEWTATAGNHALVVYADHEEILPDEGEVDNSVVTDVCAANDGFCSYRSRCGDRRGSRRLEGEDGCGFGVKRGGFFVFGVVP